MDALCAEYAAFLKARPHLVPMCARELQHELMANPEADPADLRWVRDFADRWEKLEKEY